MIRVIIVEDEAIIRKGLVLMTDWAAFGAEVIAEAANGLEGEAIIAKLNPDLVLTDIRMPGESGLEMITRLMGRCNARYIIITSYGDFEYAKQSIDLGVLAYILKPIDEVELAASIRKAVEIIHHHAEIKVIEDLKISSDGEDQRSFALFLAQTRAEMRDSRLSAAIAAIREHYNSDITAKDVSIMIGISESSFNKLFKAQTGYTFLEYLTNYRIKIAIDLLQDMNSKIYEIADLVGYSDYRYFSEVFKKLIGASPSDFRRGRGL